MTNHLLEPKTLEEMEQLQDIAYRFFRVGGCVIAICGGPVMVVVERLKRPNDRWGHKTCVRCLWFNAENNLCVDDFPVDILESARVPQ